MIDEKRMTINGWFIYFAWWFSLTLAVVLANDYFDVQGLWVGLNGFLAGLVGAIIGMWHKESYYDRVRKGEVKCH